MSKATDTQELIEFLVNGNIDTEVMTKEEIEAARKKLNPLGKAIKLENNSGKHFAYSLINLKKEYMEKELMVSIIGYLYRRSDEFGVPKGDYVKPVEELNYDEIKKQFIEENVVNGQVLLKEYTHNTISGGENYSQQETIENKFKRMVIREFLNDCFVMNPDKHVRSAYQRNAEDPERLKVNLANKPKTDTRKLKGKDAKLQEYKRMVNAIPPAELFHSFKMYIDNNYDAIRLATRDLYCDKPDLDYMIIIYDSFPTRKEYDDFVNKYENDIITELRCCVQNQWVFQSSFKENRERLQFYNSNTRVLQQILDEAEAGSKLGKDMLNKRINIAKTTNESEAGKDDEKFLENYKKDKRNEHKKAGLKNVSEMEKAELEIRKKYYNEFDIPKLADQVEDTVEVQVWTNDTKEGKLKPSSFLTKASKQGLDTAIMRQ